MTLEEKVAENLPLILELILIAIAVAIVTYGWIHLFRRLFK